MRGETLLEAILELNCDWSRTGKPGFEPMPELRMESAEYHLAVQKLRDMEIAAAPIDVKALAAIFYSLQAHYWQQDLNQKLADVRARDYARLLGGYPLDVYEAARDEWLMRPDSEHFPKIGQFKEILDEKLAERRGKQYRLETILKAAEGNLNMNPTEPYMRYEKRAIEALRSNNGMLSFEEGWGMSWYLHIAKTGEVELTSELITKFREEKARADKVYEDAINSPVEDEGDTSWIKNVKTLKRGMMARQEHIFNEVFGYYREGAEQYVDGITMQKKGESVNGNEGN